MNRVQIGCWGLLVFGAALILSRERPAMAEEIACPGVCADGTMLSEEARGLAIESPVSPVQSCGALEDMVAGGDVSVDCGVAQTIGHLFCRCATAPVTTGCSLCADRSLPQGDLEATFVSGRNATGDEVALTCRSLVLSAMGAVDSVDCRAYQSVLGAYCGCPYDVGTEDDAQVCRLCGSGSLLADPGVQVGDGESCAELEYVASKATADEDAPSCDEFRETARSLGCCKAAEGSVPEQVDDSCPVCSDGSDRSADMDYDALLYVSVSGVNVTCNILRDFMETFDETQVQSGRCRGWQSVTANYCACPEPPNLPCSVCPDGSLPPLMDGVVPFSENLTITCRNLLINAAEVEEEAASRVCPNFQRNGVAYCGCPKPVDTKCPSLCPNGDPLPDPDRELHFGLTCGQLELIASMETAEVCRGYQDVAAHYCGCPGYDITTEDSDQVCRLCGDKVPLPDFGQRTPLPNFDDATTAYCGIAEISATAGKDGQCDIIRQTSRPSCCPPTPEPTTATPSTMAPTTTAPTTVNPTTASPTTVEPTTETPTTKQPVAVVTTTDSSISTPTDRAPPCSICSDGSDPSAELNYDSLIYLPPNSTAVTCNSLRDFMAEFTSNDVESGRCSGWQTIASYHCGCPQPQDLSCTLCQDGSRPQFLDSQVGPEGAPITCRNLVVNAARIDRNATQTCTQAQILGVTECGCPVLSNTGCGGLCDGEEVPDTALEIGPGFTCGDLQLLASSAEGDLCDSYRSVGAHYCNCPGYDVTAENHDRVCRLCGDGVPLEEFGRTVAALDTNETFCGLAEIVASSHPDKCEELRASIGPNCCPSVAPATLPPSTAPVSLDISSLPTLEPTSLPPTAPTVSISTAEPSSTARSPAPTETAQAQNIERSVGSDDSGGRRLGGPLIAFLVIGGGVVFGALLGSVLRVLSPREKPIETAGDASQNPY